MKLLPPILLALNSVATAFAAGPVDVTAPPKNWGVALNGSFDSIDVFGPLNPLCLSQVWVEPVDPALNKQNSSFWFSVNPTDTYADPPKNIEVLLVPGGPGSRMGDIDEVIAFVKKTYPGLKYLIATTNKKAWKTVTAMGPDVKWVPPARWTVDGNIWTSSGVTSGLDLIFAYIEEVYGTTYARDLQGTIEFNRVKGACDDSFAEEHQVPPSGDCSQS
ncbi:hypothetical protein FGLOB1_4986 [Fusarium globosum]|uniref:Uncharacterized protein n=1 Tax=Fusarium globosum TaxID=78864 RepID=A0A8H5YF60_9HYPO|nr:hypothetical protein FGLOB1_4986 [Fusarium globosum]